MMIIRISSRSHQDKKMLLRKSTKRADHHRDIVDRLTDVIERNGQLVLRWSER
jgi:hypothetical protein